MADDVLEGQNNQCHRIEIVNCVRLQKNGGLIAPIDCSCVINGQVLPRYNRRKERNRLSTVVVMTVKDVGVIRGHLSQWLVNGSME